MLTQKMIESYCKTGSKERRSRILSGFPEKIFFEMKTFFHPLI